MEHTATKGSVNMTEQDKGLVDIFQGAAKVEIFGKLPSLIWAYIDTGRQLMEDLREHPPGFGSSMGDAVRILDILNSAAKHLENRNLRERLDGHAQMLQALNEGTISSSEFVEAFTPVLKRIEEVAGPRPQPSGLQSFGKEFLETELDRVEKIKAGRSADIIVSIDVLDEVRSYLSTEVMTEGISAILVIDNAGSLIVNIGSKIELDAIALAAVAAANFAATEQIARLIGERDFVLLFYKGHNESFHFSKIGQEYIIVTIFDNALSLGLVRLKIAEVAKVLEQKLPKREG
jgi:predicted regulator of Ras-like GTPase activity (Roadblock/LC7/MglB family)